MSPSLINHRKKGQMNPFSLFCREKSPSLTSEDSIAVRQITDSKRIFAAPIEHALQVQAVFTSSGLRVPKIVHECFTEIMMKGLEVEGLFRLSGSAVEINKLQNQFECGIPVDLASYDIHAVAGVVKKYFRSLPDAVIPDSYHYSFLKLVSELTSTEKVVSELACLIEKLPVTNYHLVRYIITLAGCIQQHVERNRMDAESLAIVFAPMCSRLEQSKKSNKRKQNELDRFIQINAKWTALWRLMIEQHQALNMHWEASKKHRAVPSSSACMTSQETYYRSSATKLSTATANRYQEHGALIGQQYNFLDPMSESTRKHIPRCSENGLGNGTRRRPSLRNALRVRWLMRRESMTSLIPQVLSTTEKAS
ncbi:hypothetical protein EC973_000396 [Apophysomyces ossiformis]|uniref:Rho-GAP domain-containing protein n=1 Tax=Apophysomyces ossiformis TaxID=679940 RepID=A0A8H7BJ83_9FUNG|nr:hypothetical protein EC973_000396 [Apophysomyces ossiformis]